MPERQNISAADAPFLTDLAGAPPDVRAVWISADDGLRLRVATFSHDAPRGTVLVFPGRTEGIEKYGLAATDLAQRGFASAVIDWRGQGLSDRLHADARLGHVRRFADYQRDVAALLAHVRAAGLPGPFFLLAHSMGGAIGLRALMAGLPVRAAAFSSPMWGISIAPHMRPVAWGLSTVARAVGAGHLMAPGQPPTSYLLRAPFEGNTLTTDAAMWDYMRRQIAAEPRLGLGGASLQWLNEALREVRRMAALPAPPVPTVAVLGLAEKIVVPAAIRDRMARWPGGTLIEVPGAEHEVLMETPDRRAMILDRFAAHFAANA
jgi:lysophospholipase